MVLGLMISACTSISVRKGTTISILEDVTETDFVSRPNAQSIQSLFNLDKEPWSSVKFRHGIISSLIHNKRFDISLNGENALFGNELIRISKIKSFKASVDSILSLSYSDKPHNSSSIFTPIVDELKILQKDSLSSTRLYVFSDLQENNSEWFSVHQYNDFKLLKTNPEKVKDLFLEHTSGLIQASNIKIIVVYQPQTIKQDKVFALMRKVYTLVFDELGIDIEFIAHLN